MNKFLIGMDVGFAHFGLSAFKLDPDTGIEFMASNHIETEKAAKNSKTRVDSDNIRRVQELTRGIDSFIYRTTGKVTEIAGDRIFVAAEFPTGGSKDSKSAMGFGLGTGMLTAYLTLRNMPFEHVTPDEVKFIATNRTRKVDKKQVEAGMTELLEAEEVTFEGENLSTYLDHYYNRKLATTGGREHVADSVAAAWWAVSYSNTYKAFVA